ncbi:MAG: patatin-like phospholipase family protein [Roseiarcus sp.]|jgi:NTE family protein
MAQPARSALVLQGGGALGAYELGAARRLYADDGFAPDLIAGVSIGAITAVLLARPAAGLTPLRALEKFWDQVTVSGWFLPPPLRPYASVLGNPGFFAPRLDVIDLSNWTSLYDVGPLRRTLASLVDLEALADPGAEPRLLVTATDVAAGEIAYFRSDAQPLSLDHIVASGSLPPSFAMTEIGDRRYWDGGLFDNTPLGAVLDALPGGPGADLAIYVVNLFPNRAPLPRNMAEVAERMLNLQFANKTAEDVKLLARFDEVARLMEALETLPADHPVKASEGYRAVLRQRYVAVPRIVAITRPEQAGGFDGNDFSPAAIAERAAEGWAQTEKALAEARDAPRAGGGAMARKPAAATVSRGGGNG